MEHEPCGLLGYTKIAGQLVRTDSVFAVDEHPDGGQPQGQLDRGVLEDRADLDGELLPAVSALPNATGFQEVVLAYAPALRAGLLPRGPAKVGDESQCSILVCEVLDGFKQSLRRIVLSVHKVEYTLNSWVCQVYYCPKESIPGVPEVENFEADLSFFKDNPLVTCGGEDLPTSIEGYLVILGGSDRLLLFFSFEHNSASHVIELASTTPNPWLPTLGNDGNFGEVDDEWELRTRGKNRRDGCTGAGSGTTDGITWNATVKLAS